MSSLMQCIASTLLHKANTKSKLLRVALRKVSEGKAFASSPAGHKLNITNCTAGVC